MRAHTHGRFSIGLIDSGTSVFTGAADEPIPLTAGDVILIPAGHLHACNPEHGRWQYQMIHADQDRIARHLPEDADGPPPEITVFRDPRLHREFSSGCGLLDPPRHRSMSARHAWTT